MGEYTCRWCGKKFDSDWKQDPWSCWCSTKCELEEKKSKESSGSSEGGSSSGGSSGGGVSVGSGLGKLLGGLMGALGKGAGSITKEIGSMCKEALDDEKSATQASKAEAESIKNMVIPSEQTELIEFMTNAVSKYNPKVKDYQTDEKRVNEAGLKRFVKHIQN